MVIPSDPAEADMAFKNESLRYYNLKTGDETVGPPRDMIVQHFKLFAKVYEHLPVRFVWDDRTQTPILINTKTGNQIRESEFPKGVHILKREEKAPSEWAPVFIEGFLAKDDRFRDEHANKYRYQDKATKLIYRKDGDVIWQVPPSSCYLNPMEEAFVYKGTQKYVTDYIHDSHIHLWGNHQNIGVEFYFLMT
jgi:hypothetical protein